MYVVSRIHDMVISWPKLWSSKTNYNYTSAMCPRTTGDSAMPIENSNSPSPALMSDAEIIAQLLELQPAIGSERNVWAFWDRGLSNCPAWCQRNAVGWVRRLAPSWTVCVLDCVEGSPLHISKYVDDSFFPEVLNQQKLAGPHVGPPYRRSGAPSAAVPLRWRLARRWIPPLPESGRSLLEDAGRSHPTV